MTDSLTLGRRGFLGAAGVVGAGLVLPVSRAFAQAKPGGTFRVAIGDFKSTDTLDPTRNDTKFFNISQFILRNTLVEVAADGSLIPELATSWDSSKDAKTWVFKIRSGVTFHNGKSLTAQDVVYSIQIHLAKDTTSPIKPLLQGITSLKATGPLEVTFTLASGNVGLPAVLTNPAATIIPDGTTNFADGMGTGGYKLDSWQPGVSATFTKTGNYWKAGRAHFDSIQLLAVADPAARTSALMGGQVDAYNQVDFKTVRLLQRSPAIEIISTPSKAHYVFPMMMTMAPFNDPDVVTAMKYAINREEMVKRVLNGFGTVGNDQPISASYQYFNADLPQRAYDPDRAKSLLKKAGKSDLSVTLNVSEVPFSGATDAAVLYQQHAKKAGITIQVKRVPDDGYWSNVWTKVPLCASRWSGRPDEDIMIGGVYTSDAIKAGWNETGMSDPQLDQLVVAAREELDETKRRQMYYDMQEIIHTRGSANIFAFANFVDATSKKIGHNAVGKDWDLDGFRAPERWWFA